MSGQDSGTREQRLKAALRDNLKRRKAQARGREATGDDARDGEGACGEAAPEPVADRTGGDRR